MLECVVNISEGRDDVVLQSLGAAAGGALLDVHRDADHHRSVFTLAGPDVEAAARALATAAIERLDLGRHHGVHPRIGVVDVVPFVPLAGATLADAIEARDRFAQWAAATHGLPCFAYGPERTLPDVRRGAFTTLAPDAGPLAPHPTAGGCAVGARPLLVAYNLWLDGGTLAEAKAIAAAVRRPGVRTLGLAVGTEVQVSMNLIVPDQVGPAEAWDAVAVHAPIGRAELVGLVPDAVLRAIDPARWAQLDLAPERTIEGRLGPR